MSVEAIISKTTAAAVSLPIQMNDFRNLEAHQKPAVMVPDSLYAIGLAPGETVDVYLASPENEGIEEIMSPDGALVQLTAETNVLMFDAAVQIKVRKLATSGAVGVYRCRPYK